MTKFASIWGDLDVNNVAPVDSSKEAKTEEPKNPSEKAKDEEGGTPPADKEEEEDQTIVATITHKAGEPAEEKKEDKKPAEQSEEFEISEEEVGKAYAVLKKEGVLDLTEEEEEELESTPGGLADAVSIAVRKKYQAEIDATPKVVQELYAHVAAGNDWSTFKPQEEFSWKEADVEDEDVKKQALKLLYLDQGMSEEDANSEVEEVISSDKFDKKAELAIDVLTKKEEKAEVAKAAKLAEADTKRQKDREKEISDIEALIDSADDLAGFKLDETKRKGFKDYLFKINPRTGKTQFLENMGSADRKLKIAFLDFVNYTKADLEKEVASTLTKDRKKKLSAFSDTNVKSTSSSRVVKTNTEANKGKIVFPAIFGTHKIEVED